LKHDLEDGTISRTEAESYLGLGEDAKRMLREDPYVRERIARGEVSPAQLDALLDSAYKRLRPVDDPMPVLRNRIAEIVDIRSMANRALQQLENALGREAAFLAGRRPSIQLFMERYMEYLQKPPYERLRTEFNPTLNQFAETPVPNANGWKFFTLREAGGGIVGKGMVIAINPLWGEAAIVIGKNTPEALGAFVANPRAAVAVTP
jgi:hypothetical protein